MAEGTSPSSDNWRGGVGSGDGCVAAIFSSDAESGRDECGKGGSLDEAERFLSPSIARLEGGRRAECVRDGGLVGGRLAVELVRESSWTSGCAVRTDVDEDTFDEEDRWAATRLSAADEGRAGEAMCGGM